MKKLLAILLTAGMLAGCNDEGANETTTGDTTVTVAPADTTIAVPDTTARPADTTIKK